MIYDVIDGKQRLETILMFTGDLRGNKFSAKVQLPGSESAGYVDWNYLKRRKLNSIITDYRITAIEVDGNFNNIIDLFVRINSTGKALSKAEKQHAKYYNSPFLKTGAAIASKFEGYFTKNNIVSPGQVSRMKHVELVCEIMLSVYQGDVINKKAALDKVMEKDYLTSNQIKKAKERTIRSINRVRRIFPRLKETRFKQISDYYILIFLFAKYEADGFILIDRKRNKLAWDIMREFAIGVDKIREKQKRFEGANETERMYRDYLSTVLQSSDEISQRKKRLEILNGLLGSLIEKKDSQRGFSQGKKEIALAFI